MSEGVPKKLCIVAIAINAITRLGEDAENKIWFVAGIVLICVVFKVVQGAIDWMGIKIKKVKHDDSTSG